MRSVDKYKKLEDEDIIALIRSGEQTAVDFLMEKYKYLVRQKAKTLFMIGGDKDDLIQEGMIGLFKAIRDFKSGKDSSFTNFAELCISRQIYSAIKASNRQKNIPLNNYISLYSPVNVNQMDHDENTSLLDVMHQNKDSNPEDLVIDKENVSMLEYELESRLSNFEKEVVRLYLSGFKYVQIAQILGKQPKSIDNALQRIKSKLNQILQLI